MRDGKLGSVPSRCAPVPRVGTWEGKWLLGGYGTWRCENCRQVHTAAGVGAVGAQQGGKTRCSMSCGRSLGKLFLRPLGGGPSIDLNSKLMATWGQLQRNPPV